MEEINLKILLVGDTCVGKTSLLLRYIDDDFPDKHLTTVGVEHLLKSFEYRGFNIQLQIWDTAGQERYRSVTNSFFHNADGILFVYDLTNENTFEGVKNWIEESEKRGNDAKKILLGNKCDLKHKKKVSDEEVKIYLKDNDLDFFETSAKENINIKEAFEKITELIFMGKSDEEIKMLYGVRKSNLTTYLEKDDKKKTKNCC